MRKLPMRGKLVESLNPFDGKWRGLWFTTPCERVLDELFGWSHRVR